MIRRTAVMALVAPMLWLAAPAHANDQTYLDYLDAHGFKYQNRPGLATPEGAVRFGQIICDNIRHGRPPRDRFDKTIANSIGQVMVDAAQHELCPDTLARTAQPTPELPPTQAVPAPPQTPPPPETPPTPEAPEPLPPPGLPEPPPPVELPPPPPETPPTPAAPPAPGAPAG